MEILIVIIIAFMFLIIGSIPTIKYFMNKGKVRVMIARPNRELIVFKTKPHGDKIKYEDETYDLDNDKYIISKGMPTFYFNYKNTVPLNPYTLQITDYNPELYTAGLESKIIEDIIVASKKNNKFDLPVVSMLISGVTLVGLFLVAFFLNDKLTVMYEQINTIIEALKQVGIGGLS